MNKVANKIWASQRYTQLIHEYIDRSILPPPLILLSYVFKIIFKIYKFIYDKHSSLNETNLKKSKFSKLLVEKKQRFRKINTDQHKLIEWYENMSQEFFCQSTEKW